MEDLNPSGVKVKVKQDALRDIIQKAASVLFQANESSL